MGAGTAFLQGFVDAENTKRYEDRMAEHEQFIFDRADEQYKERDEEARAREIADDAKVAARQKAATEANQAFQMSLQDRSWDYDERTRSTAKKEDDQRRRDRIAALYPNFSADALDRATEYGDEAFELIAAGWTFNDDGSLQSRAVNRDANSTAYAMRHKPTPLTKEQWVNSPAYWQIYEIAYANEGNYGMQDFIAAGGEIKLIPDPENRGIYISAELVYPTTPTDYTNISDAEFKSGREAVFNVYNSLNAVSDMALDPTTGIMSFSGFAGILDNKIMELATNSYHALISSGQPPRPFPIVAQRWAQALSPYMADISNQNIAMADSIWDKFESDPTTVSAEELAFAGENFNARVNLDRNYGVNTGDTEALSSRLEQIDAAAEELATTEAADNEDDDADTRREELLAPQQRAINERSLARRLEELERVLNRQANIERRYEAFANDQEALDHMGINQAGRTFDLYERTLRKIQEEIEALNAEINTLQAALEE